MIDHLSDSDVAWLLGEEAQQWLDEASTVDLPAHQLAQRLRRSLSPDQARLVMEQADLRRRAARKFTRSGHMYFTRVGLEQATDEWIARYKAERLVGRSVLDLCAGVGGDAIGLSGTASRLHLIDRSPTLVQFASRNVQVSGPSDAGHVQSTVADVAEAEVEAVDAWHIDPDRRPTGGRTTQAELHEPSDALIDRLISKNPNAAVKLAPGCEPPTRWVDEGELEWVSRDGECKQLVVWQGELTMLPGRRRATVLRTVGDDWQLQRTLVGDATIVPHGERIEQYVFEPDAAVLASDLVGELAAEYGWSTFSSTTGYLTGTVPVDDPAVTAFEVVDVLPLQVKKLARYLRERSVGNLEIKHRAVDLSPDRLRRDLKLEGDNAATLLMTRVGEKRIAIVARRVESVNTKPESIGT